MTLLGQTLLGPLLLLATPLLPLLLLLAGCLSRRCRAALPSLLAIAPLPGLAAALWAGGSSVTFDESRLQMGFELDGPQALLLGATSLLWSLAGAFTTRFQREDTRRGRFAIAWLLSLSGCLGVFVAADLALFYLLYALVSLAAYGLVVHEGTAPARRAALVYISLAVFGEACLLLAFVLLSSASPSDSLRVDVAIAALPEYRLRDQAIIFLLLGFGLKAGLVPLHGWLPLAHPAAPAPGSAVLSGAIIKTGVIGLIAFLPLDPGCATWGAALMIIGWCTAFYCALVGLTQGNPKTVLAYSSASQMGVVAALVGAGIAATDAASPMVASFYALHHVLVKGALFLGVGIYAATGGGARRLLLLVLGLLGLSIAGLPVSGGSLAKLATKGLFDTPVLKICAALSATASAALMVHFALLLRTKSAEQGAARTPPLGTLLPWALTALASMLLPWWLYAPIAHESALGSLAPAALWGGLWPLLAGAGVAFLWRNLGIASARRGGPLAAVPAGDLLVALEGVWRMIVLGCARFESLDRALSRWWLACTLLLVTLLLIGVLGG